VESLTVVVEGLPVPCVVGRGCTADQDGVGHEDYNRAAAAGKQQGRVG
jgi:hypothetical protein